MSLNVKTGDNVVFTIPNPMLGESVTAYGTIVKIDDIPKYLKDAYYLGIINIEELSQNLYATVESYYSGDIHLFRIPLSKLETIKNKMSNEIKKENKQMELYTISFPKEDPVIVDYKVFNNKVVVVWFNDGSTEKATCDEQDTYSLERAIEVCVVKKKYGGSSKYNKAIKAAMKQIDFIDNKKKAEKEEADRIANKKEKEIERKIKRKEKKRQDKIDMIAEAITKAMGLCGNNSDKTIDEAIDKAVDEIMNDTSVDKTIDEAADKFVDEIMNDKAVDEALNKFANKLIESMLN